MDSLADLLGGADDVFGSPFDDVSASSVVSTPTVSPGFSAAPLLAAAHDETLDDASMTGMTPLTLSLIQQDSLLVEPWAQNGLTRQAHVCAKNVPFVLQLGQANFDATGPDSPWQLHAELVFDGRDTGNLVPVLLNKDPMTYRVYAKEASISVEFRVAVLSSHHDNALFRIRISARSSTPQADGQFAVHELLLSEPIRMVSKPTQAVRGKRRRTSPTNLQAKREQSNSASTANRAVLSQINDRLAMIEASQRELVRSLQTGDGLSSSARVQDFAPQQQAPAAAASAPAMSTSAEFLRAMSQALANFSVLNGENNGTAESALRMFLSSADPATVKQFVLSVQSAFVSV
jgi:hypothetical protein